MRYATAVWVLILLTLFAPVAASGADGAPLHVVAANNNRTPAGILKDGALNVRLELRQARWYAEAQDGVYEDVYAFGEEGHAPQISGPLLRVPQGTRIHASIHNLLPLSASIYGLHSHPTDRDEAIQVPANCARCSSTPAIRARTCIGRPPPALALTIRRNAAARKPCSAALLSSILR
jgi:hypothetical protein